MKVGRNGSLSLALAIHSDRLLFIHLFMLSSHLYYCLPLVRHRSIFPSSMTFYQCWLLMWPHYFTCPVVISFISSPLVSSYSRCSLMIKTIFEILYDNVCFLEGHTNWLKLILLLSWLCLSSLSCAQQVQCLTWQ